MPRSSTRFHTAIMRRPPASAVNGIRATDRGAPDITRMASDHAAYVAAMGTAGLRVVVLEALEEFPDSHFVEDVALCLPEGIVMLRPGAPSREGEVAAMRPALAREGGEIHDINGPGTIEGGDILVTPKEILVGLSARTNREGAEELARIVARWGYRLRMCRTPAGVLHLKTDCALLDDETILATHRLAQSGALDSYRVLQVPYGEEAAANVVRVNDHVIMPAGFPRTEDMLSRAGYDILPLRNDEFALLDGGMSCLSLRL